MKKTAIAVGAAVLATLIAGQANAYTVKGSVECPDIMREDSNSEFRLANKWWILGYITARNYVNDDSVGSGVDNDVIYDIALEYCRRNRNKDWDDAAIYTYDRLKY